MRPLAHQPPSAGARPEKQENEVVRRRLADPRSLVANTWAASKAIDSIARRATGAHGLVATQTRFHRWSGRAGRTAVPGRHRLTADQSGAGIVPRPGAP